MKNQTLKLGGATIALTLALASGAFAQSMSTTMPMAMPMMHPANTLTTGPVDEQLDYSNTIKIDKVDLAIAKAMHYSDKQTAKIYKIAKKGNVDFRDVIFDVQRGMTFVQVADKYGVSYGELKDVTKEQDEIDAYRAATAATGEASMKRPSVLGSQYPQPGSKGFTLAPPNSTQSTQ